MALTTEHSTIGRNNWKILEGYQKRQAITVEIKGSYSEEGRFIKRQLTLENT